MSAAGVVRKQNDLAVSLLKGKDLSSAVVASVEALHCFQRAFVASSPKHDLTNTEETQIDELDRCLMRCSPKSAEEGTYEIEGNTFFIYNQGIVLSSDAALTMNNHHTVSAILIFNTALAHQLLAIKVRQRRRNLSVQLSLKAKELYELACKSIPTTQTAWFQFAIMNNVAVIELMLGNAAESKAYFDHLWSFWLSNVAAECSNHFPCMQGFIWNVVTVCGRKSMDTAAAA